MEECAGGLEPRVARIEADMANLKETVTRLDNKIDRLDDKIDDRFDKIDDRFEKLDQRLHADLGDLGRSLDTKFTWIVTTMIAFGAALLATMAEGFHWLK